MSRKTKNVLAGIIVFTVFLAVLTAVLFVLHRRFGAAWMLASAVTALTFFYHFAMRLAVGEAVDALCKGRSFPQDKRGFAIYGFEKELYKKLRVKEWKAGAITAKPEYFDINSVSPEELLHNVMQAELVHRIIMPLSFVPLLFIIPFGAPLVFILTSIAACLLDLQFVIIQRFNRPRVIKYAELKARRRKT